MPLRGRLLFVACYHQLLLSCKFAYHPTDVTHKMMKQRERAGRANLQQVKHHSPGISCSKFLHSLELGVFPPPTDMKGVQLGSLGHLEVVNDGSTIWPCHLSGTLQSGPDGKKLASHTLFASEPVGMRVTARREGGKANE